MAMEDKEFEKLIACVRKPIPPGLNIIPGSVPIPFFGDFENAEVCTIGINPGRSEFNTVWGKEHPRHRKACFNKADDDPLSKDDAKRVIEFCKDYYSGRKGGIEKFWLKLETLVQKFPGCKGYSYLGGDIVHLDIVPWATDPNWGDLRGKDKRDELLKSGREYFRGLLRAKKFRYIFLNGKIVSDTLTKKGKTASDALSDVFTKTGTFDLAKITANYTATESCRFGDAGGQNIIGWNTFIGKQAKNLKNMSAAIAKRYAAYTKKEAR
jgi:hypothetical protein